MSDPRTEQEEEQEVDPREIGEWGGYGEVSFRERQDAAEADADARVYEEDK